MYTSENNTLLNIKSVLRLILSIILYYSGAIELFRYCRRKFAKNNSVKILAYHDISNKTYLNLHIPSEIFLEHIKYLISHKYNLISLSDAVKLLKSKRPIPEDTVIITFDDVYKSYYEEVYPIVKRFNIPITIFICTEPLDSKSPLFIDVLIYAIHNTAKNSINLTSLGLGNYSLKTHCLKENVIHKINEYSKAMDTKERRGFLEEICNGLDIDSQSSELTNILLSWNEVIEMSVNKNIEFGAHTVSHPSLSSISLFDANEEVRISKEIIQQKINKEVRHFAYPFGSRDDYNGKVEEIVKNNGFSVACTLHENDEPGSIDMFRLGRMCVSNQIESGFLRVFAKAVFAMQVSGITDVFDFRKYHENIMNREHGKIRILYLIDQLETGAGTERHLMNLVSRLDKNRFECRVYYFEGQHGRIQEEMIKNGIIVKKINLSRIYSHKAFMKAFQLIRDIRKNKIDIVQTFHFKSDTYGVFLALLSRVSKIVSSRRDTGDLKKPRQIALNKIMNRYIDRFIMVCDAVGKKVNMDEGVPFEKMTTIYNGVDLSMFTTEDSAFLYELRKELGFKENDFIVGTTAIFRPEKAYHVLLKGIEKAMPHIDNLKVLILGDGPLRKKYEAYCNKSALKNIVKFMGYVDNVQGYLQCMDVFCLVPNKNEGFSNAILEAMALGKPVIATDIGGNAESVVQNDTGIIIQPDNSEELKDAILKLYNDSNRRLSMGRMARNRIKSIFSLEKMVQEHENFYEDVLKEVIK